MDMNPIPGCESPGSHLYGWMAPVELDWLFEQAAAMDSVAEIGVLRGRSCFALLKGCRGPVYAIDPWDDEGGQCLPDFLVDCGHFPNLNVVRGYSPAAAALVPSVDMTFIDGDHAYDSIIADIDAWLPKTRKLICGHDYQNANGGYPDVAIAVHERFPGRYYNPPGTSIWAVDL